MSDDAQVIEAEALTPAEELKIAEKNERINSTLDRQNLMTLEASPRAGGIFAVNYNQLLDIAKTMATAKYGIPHHLRGNIGDCLAIRELALNTGLSPYGLAQHSYIVKQMLCYDAQIIHAIIGKWAPLEERLDFTYDGSLGDGTRTCTVTGTFRGDSKSKVYTTLQIKDIKPKNSPLWVSDPDQQLGYLAVRRWGKRHCPDILLGVYTKDELEDSEIPDQPETEASPNLMTRLSGKLGETGFAENVVDATLAGNSKTKTTAAKKAGQTKKRKDKPKTEPKATAAKTEPKQEAKSAQAATKPEPEIELPDNKEQYFAHVRDWLKDYDTKDDVEAHWKMERQLRNACGMVSEETAEIKAEVDAKIEKLKK